MLCRPEDHVFMYFYITLDTTVSTNLVSKLGFEQFSGIIRVMVEIMKQILENLINSVNIDAKNTKSIGQRKEKRK